MNPQYRRCFLFVLFALYCIDIRAPVFASVTNSSGTIPSNHSSSSTSSSSPSHIAINSKITPPTTNAITVNSTSPSKALSHTYIIEDPLPYSNLEDKPFTPYWTQTEPKSNRSPTVQTTAALPF